MVGQNEFRNEFPDDIVGQNEFRNLFTVDIVVPATPPISIPAGKNSIFVKILKIPAYRVRSFWFELKSNFYPV
jgi:hypothetical protein